MMSEPFYLERELWNPDQPLLEYVDIVSAALDRRDSDPARDKHAEDEELDEELNI